MPWLALTTDHLVRDVLEGLIVVAVGGMLWSAVVALRKGEIRPYRCVACERPTSRAYPCCRHCGAEQAPVDDGSPPFMNPTSTR